MFRNRDRQERAFKQLTDIRRQALKLSTNLLSVLSDNSNNRGNAIDRTSTATVLHRELRAVRAIAMDIWAVHKADQSSDCVQSVNRLSTVFKRLADLLRSGEQAITAYELTISGIVPALLLCLSASHAGQWSCPVNFIATIILLFALVSSYLETTIMVFLTKLALFALFGMLEMRFIAHSAVTMYVSHLFACNQINA